MIRLEKPHNAPGCYLIVDIKTGRDILVQLDYDFCGIASSFGWSPCDCGDTDGTVDCEHKTADQMISEARKYLDDNLGAVADDPGYFE